MICNNRHHVPLRDGGNRCAKLLKKKEKPRFDGIMLYFWWNIWKERNRRTFQHSSMEVEEVASVITNNINLYQNARTIED
jgi:hypothetical protein